MGNICLKCSSKSCKSTDYRTLDICDYGVAFYNNNGQIIKKEERLTLQYMSQNLRHELNKVLQIIISDAIKIDPTISTKRIDIDNPTSRIVGGIVVIDQFIEMITGVNEFSPVEKYSENLEKEASLFNIIDRSVKIYSLIRNNRRAKRLKFNISCSKKLKIGFGAKIIEYIVSILCDNIWKYSISESEAKIVTSKNKSGDIVLRFLNKSQEICDIDKIFEKGYQCDYSSEGFGYGLFWAKILVDRYNDLSGRREDLLELKHYQTWDDNAYEQNFILENIRI